MCVFCKAVDFKTDSPDCTNGGRYCSPDPDFNGPLTGRDVILENLKQKCIYQNSHEVYHAYLESFVAKCFVNNVWAPDWKDCVKNIDSDHNINEDHCIQNGFFNSRDYN